MPLTYGAGSTAEIPQVGAECSAACAHPAQRQGLTLSGVFDPCGYMSPSPEKERNLARHERTGSWQKDEDCGAWPYSPLSLIFVQNSNSLFPHVRRSQTTSDFGHIADDFAGPFHMALNATSNSALKTMCEESEPKVKHWVALGLVNLLSFAPLPDRHQWGLPLYVCGKLV